MKKLWHKFGENLLSKIQIGNLKVIYPNSQIKYYGNKLDEEICLEIHDYSFFKNLLFYGDIGFAESYMNKEFSVNNLTNLIKIALLNSKHIGIKSEDNAKNFLINLLPHFNKVKHLLRKNSKKNSRKNISEHYDLSNDFYKLFLDDTMMYSAAIFKDKDEDLYTAQKRKIEHLANKLNLKKGDNVLEIGSGWGSMALHLAKEKQCKVTTVTLSTEQKRLCEQKFKENNVEESINIFLKDYRDLEGKFDAIIAVEMFEAVGNEYFDIFFKKCEALLKPSGVVVLQIITMPDQRYKHYSNSTDFIQKYIFPGGHLPSVSKILETTTKHTNLNLLHMEEFTEDYAKTLNIWYQNFLNKKEEIKSLGFDDYFLRMWEMYLNYCEAAFLTRNVNLVQVTLTRDQNIDLNKGLVA